MHHNCLRCHAVAPAVNYCGHCILDLLNHPLSDPDSAASPVPCNCVHWCCFCSSVFHLSCMTHHVLSSNWTCPECNMPIGVVFSSNMSPITCEAIQVAHSGGLITATSTRAFRTQLASTHATDHQLEAGRNEEMLSRIISSTSSLPFSLIHPRRAGIGAALQPRMTWQDLFERASLIIHRTAALATHSRPLVCFMCQGRLDSRGPAFHPCRRCDATLDEASASRLVLDIVSLVADRGPRLLPVLQCIEDCHLDCLLARLTDVSIPRCEHCFRSRAAIPHGAGAAVDETEPMHTMSETHVLSETTPMAVTPIAVLTTSNIVGDENKLEEEKHERDNKEDPDPVTCVICLETLADPATMYHNCLSCYCSKLDDDATCNTCIQAPPIVDAPTSCTCTHTCHTCRQSSHLNCTLQYILTTPLPTCTTCRTPITNVTLLTGTVTIADIRASHPQITPSRTDHLGDEYSQRPDESPEQHATRMEQVTAEHDVSTSRPGFAHFHPSLASIFARQYAVPGVPIMPPQPRYITEGHSDAQGSGGCSGLPANETFYCWRQSFFSCAASCSNAEHWRQPPCPLDCPQRRCHNPDHAPPRNSVPQICGPTGCPCSSCLQLLREANAVIEEDGALAPLRSDATHQDTRAAFTFCTVTFGLGAPEFRRFWLELLHRAPSHYPSADNLGYASLRALRTHLEQTNALTSFQSFMSTEIIRHLLRCKIGRFVRILLSRPILNDPTTRTMSMVLGHDVFLQTFSSIFWRHVSRRRPNDRLSPDNLREGIPMYGQVQIEELDLAAAEFATTLILPSNELEENVPDDWFACATHPASQDSLSPSHQTTSRTYKYLLIQCLRELGAEDLMGSSEGLQPLLVYISDQSTSLDGASPIFQHPCELSNEQLLSLSRSLDSPIIIDESSDSDDDGAGGDGGSNSDTLANGLCTEHNAPLQNQSEAEQPIVLPPVPASSVLGRHPREDPTEIQDELPDADVPDPIADIPRCASPPDPDRPHDMVLSTTYLEAARGRRREAQRQFVSPSITSAASASPSSNVRPARVRARRELSSPTAPSSAASPPLPVGASPSSLMSLMPAVGPVNQSNVRRRLAVVDVETARAAIIAPDIVPHEMLAALRASIEPSLPSSSLEPHPLPTSTSTDPIQTSNPFVSISNWMPNADAAEATSTCLHLVAIGITTEMATNGPSAIAWSIYATASTTDIEFDALEPIASNARHCGVQGRTVAMLMAIYEGLRSIERDERPVVLHHSSPHVSDWLNNVNRIGRGHAVMAIQGEIRRLRPHLRHIHHAEVAFLAALRTRAQACLLLPSSYTTNRSIDRESKFTVTFRNK